MLITVMHVTPLLILAVVVIKDISLIPQVAQHVRLIVGLVVMQLLVLPVLKDSHLLQLIVKKASPLTPVLKRTVEHIRYVHLAAVYVQLQLHAQHATLNSY